MMPYEFENKELFTSKPSTIGLQIKLETAIVDYFKHGWKAIPCRLTVDSKHYKDSKKHPDFGINIEGKYRKWGDAVLQLDHLVDSLRTFKSAYLGLPANALAIVCGDVSDLFVIDCDAPRETAFKYLSDAGIKIYSDTYSVLSPNGGVHLYYRFDKRLNDYPSTSSKFFGKDSPVDIRSTGGLIFAPPSQILNRDTEITTYYKIDIPADEPGKKLKIYDAPDAIIKMIINRHGDRAENEKVNAVNCTKTFDSLSPKQKEWLNKDIQTLSDAQEGSRSEKCFALLCTCLKLHLKKDIIKNICDPLPKFRDRPDFFDRVYTSALSSVDVAIRDYSPKKFNIGSDGRQLKGTLQGPVDENMISDLATKILTRDKTLPSLEWLITNFMAKKMIGMIVGPPSIGKTMVCLDMCKSIITASDLWGCISVNNKSKILYIQFELAENVFYNNYISRIDIDKHPEFSYLSKDTVTRINDGISLTLDRENPKGRSLFENLIAKSDADMIIIDSLKHCFVGEINRSEVMSELLMWLKGVASKNNKLIFIVHHLRKRYMLRKGEIPADYTLDDLYGSGTISSTIDFAYCINEIFDPETCIKKERTGKICNIKAGSVGESIFKEAIYTIVNSHDKQGNKRVHIDYTSEADLSVDVGTSKEELLKILYHNPKIKSGDLFEKIGINATIPRRTFYDILKDLERINLIQRFGSTKNQFINISEKGKKYLESLNAKIEQEPLDMGQEKEEERKQTRCKFMLWVMIDASEPGNIRPIQRVLKYLKEDYEGILKLHAFNDDEVTRITTDNPDYEKYNEIDKESNKFNEDLDYLVDQGYFSISLDENNEHMVELTNLGKIIVQKCFPNLFNK